MKRVVVSVALAVVCLLAAPVVAFGALGALAPAQAQPAQGRLLITVVDPTNGVLPFARVTITGAEPATAAVKIEAVLTSPQGVATVPNLPPGRYTIQAEFDGLETTIVRDARVRAGDNRQTVVLPLPKLQGAVTVGVDKQIAAADRGQALGTALTREQLAALSDDPDELRAQLQAMAGVDAIFRVDSFEGAALPPKAQIKAIHITRDAFAAENHSSGGLFVDIITQPGMGPMRGGMNARLRDDAFNARNPFAPTKGPEQSQSYNFNIGGTIKPEKSSFSLSVGGTHSYQTAILRAAAPSGTTVSQVVNQRTPNDFLNLSALVDYAVTKDQTLRFGFSQFRSSAENQGIGAYDLPTRAFDSDSRSYNLRVQEAGPLGRRFFINTRASININNSDTTSDLEAPTLIVLDAFTAGGAQRAGGIHSKSINFASDLDYVRGIHSIRTGILLMPEWYHSDDRSNYLGTYTFESLDDYNAGIARSYTRRAGDPHVDYFFMQGGAYVQDDIRVRKNLTLSPGLRIDGVTHVKQNLAPAPRFGVTWAPFKSGRTTLRTSVGMFYDWFGPSAYEQSLRVDGYRQSELTILDPIYDPLTIGPDTGGTIPPGTRYLIGDNVHFAELNRISAGIDQTISPRVRVSATYAYLNGRNWWRGNNLNTPIDGVRPDPAFANVIEAVSDGRSAQHSLNSNVSVNLARIGAPGGGGPVFGVVNGGGPVMVVPAGGGPLPPPPPGAAVNRGPRRFDWRRMTVNANYFLGRALSSAGQGAYTVPASGTVAGEWGPSQGDVRHRVNVGMLSSQLRDLSANITFNAATGSPYDIRTGRDDNGDTIFNDRPAGVGRNAGRTTGQWTLNGFFTYSVPIGRRTVALPPGISINAPGGGAPQVTVGSAQAASRYRMTLGVQIQNITNHNNFTRYSGVMTSPFFGQPQDVMNPRKFDFQVGLTF